jgi:hypothetical protein
MEYGAALLRNTVSEPGRRMRLRGKYQSTPQRIVRQRCGER